MVSFTSPVFQRKEFAPEATSITESPSQMLWLGVTDIDTPLTTPTSCVRMFTQPVTPSVTVTVNPNVPVPQVPKSKSCDAPAGVCGVTQAGSVFQPKSEPGPVPVMEMVDSRIVSV